MFRQIAGKFIPQLRVRRDFTQGSGLLESSCWFPQSQNRCQSLRNTRDAVEFPVTNSLKKSKPRLSSLHLFHPGWAKIRTLRCYINLHSLFFITRCWAQTSSILSHNINLSRGLVGLICSPISVILWTQASSYPPSDNVNLIVVCV
jgi:hypothetical protein